MRTSFRKKKKRRRRRRGRRRKSCTFVKIYRSSPGRWGKKESTYWFWMVLLQSKTGIESTGMRM